MENLKKEVKVEEVQKPKDDSVMAFFDYLYKLRVIPTVGSNL